MCSSYIRALILVSLSATRDTTLHYIPYAQYLWSYLHPALSEVLPSNKLCRTPKTIKRNALMVFANTPSLVRLWRKKHLLLTLREKKEKETLCAVREMKRYSLIREKRMKSFAILRVKNTPRSSVFQQGALSTKFLTATRVYEPHCLIPDQ